MSLVMNSLLFPIGNIQFNENCYYWWYNDSAIAFIMKTFFMHTIIVIYLLC